MPSVSAGKAPMDSSLSLSISACIAAPEAEPVTSWSAPSAATALRPARPSVRHVGPRVTTPSW